MEQKKKVVYIAGRISGVPEYKEAFARVEEELQSLGLAVLNPARLPSDLGRERAMRICMAMIDEADVVYFRPGWNMSVGAQLEMAYCKYTGKKYATQIHGLVGVVL